MQGSLAILAFRVCRRVRCFQKLPLLLDFVLDVRFMWGVLSSNLQEFHVSPTSAKHRL